MLKHRVFLLIICSLFAGIVNSNSYKLRRSVLNDEDSEIAKVNAQSYWQNIQKQIAATKEQTSVKLRDTENETEAWTGRWLPARPEDPTPPPKVFHRTDSLDDHDIEQSSMKHGMEMGVQPQQCDDGKSNLGVDWDWSPVNYTCYQDRIEPSYSIDPMVYCERIPSSYAAIHKCMSETIEYDDDIPVYGSHRPVWPTYGEYKFLPRQRWMHSLEHGAIVMLYHPCANPLEVKHLKTILAGCMRRHIITPYTLLDEDRPLALLSWGCRLTMSYVNPKVVRKFILQKALHGPEKIAKSGIFNEYLIAESKTVSDRRDTHLCPDM